MTKHVHIAAGRAGKIAILIPTFNAGLFLIESVSSIARAGLPRDAYEIIVTDNASDDGSVDRLPPVDAHGVPITVRHNASNLGRVENWNRAVGVAEEMGFSFAAFLMTGDVLKDDSIVELRDRMVRTGAALGLASYEVVDENLRGLRIARRVRWRGDPDAGMPADCFLKQSFAMGAMLYGPLGANLYRIDGPARLRFDPSEASHTDQMATALFALRVARPIVYLDRPVSCWRRRAARFHSSMSAWQRLEDDRRVIRLVCHDAQIVPDYPKLRAALILRSMFLGAGDLRAILRSILSIAGDGPVSWCWLARLFLRWLAYKTPWLVEA